MKKYILILFVLSFNNVGLYSQMVAEYEPLVFDSLTPHWIHVSYDSTIVGYEIPNPRSIVGFDGYSHVFLSDIELQPLIHEGFYYKISRTLYDTDVSGGLIEKIDMSNGAVVWKQVFDLRTQNRREFIARSYIKDEKLILVDLDIVTPDVPNVPVPIVAFSGFDTYGLLKIREYDLETGNLLSVSVAEENEEDVMLIRSASDFSTHISMMNDSTFQVIDYISDYPGNLASYLLIDTINKQGKYLNSTDTIFSSYRFDADWTDTRRYKGLNLVFDEVENNILWLDDYIPGDYTSDTTKIRLMVAGQNETEIVELPFLFLFDTPPLGSIILDVTDDFVLLAATYIVDSNDLRFFVVNKNNWELEYSFYLHSFHSNFTKPHVTNDGVLVYPRTISYDTGPHIQFLTITDGELTVVSEFAVENPAYSFVPERAISLDDGNYLVTGLHAQYTPGEHLRGRFMSDFLISPRMIGVETGINTAIGTNIGIEIFPNPSTDWVNVRALGTNGGLIRVANPLGQEIMNRELPPSETIELDFSNYSSGVYYLRYIIGNESITKPITISR